MQTGCNSSNTQKRGLFGRSRSIRTPCGSVIAPCCRTRPPRSPARLCSRTGEGGMQSHRGMPTWGIGRAWDLRQRQHIRRLFIRQSMHTHCALRNVAFDSGHRDVPQPHNLAQRDVLVVHCGPRATSCGGDHSMMMTFSSSGCCPGCSACHRATAWSSVSVWCRHITVTPPPALAASSF